MEAGLRARGLGAPYRCGTALVSHQLPLTLHHDYSVVDPSVALPVVSVEPPGSSSDGGPIIPSEPGRRRWVLGVATMPSRGARTDRRYKLTWAQIREIRARYAAGGIMQRALAAVYNVTPMAISAIIHRRTWRENSPEHEGGRDAAPPGRV